jgi:hypothetical protein
MLHLITTYNAVVAHRETRSCLPKPFIQIPMHHQNPIFEDVQLLQVFRNVGVQLLQQVTAVMSAPPFNTLFKAALLTGQNELPFTYLDHTFKMQIEVLFNHTRMPKSALLTTYHVDAMYKNGREEIISYAFDLDYTVNGIYTRETFAEHYLIEFHQNVKKSFSDNNMAFQIKLTGR